MNISKNTSKILEFLLSNPIEQYNVNQIARNLSLSVGSAHKILKALEKNNIVESNKMANSIYYRLNLKNELTRKLCEVLLIEKRSRQSGIVKVYANELINYKGKVKAIILFGSILTKKEKANDVDVLFIISGKKEVKKINDFCLEISKVRTKPIVPLIMTEKDLKEKIREKNNVILEIIRTGLILSGEEMIINSIKGGIKNG